MIPPLCGLLNGLPIHCLRINSTQQADLWGKALNKRLMKKRINYPVLSTFYVLL